MEGDELKKKKKVKKKMVKKMVKNDAGEEELKKTK